MFLKNMIFFSELKNKSALNEEYEDAKILFKKLKRRNLNNINDLYNAQNVILLRETFKNRAQIMQVIYVFIHRRRSLAGSLSGCIERKKSKVIITLLTNGEVIECF